MCRGIVEHVGENMPFARGNVVLLHCSILSDIVNNFIKDWFADGM